MNFVLWPTFFPAKRRVIPVPQTSNLVITMPQFSAENLVSKSCFKTLPQNLASKPCLKILPQNPVSKSCFKILSQKLVSKSCLKILPQKTLPTTTVYVRISFYPPCSIRILRTFFEREGDPHAHVASTLDTTSALVRRLHEPGPPASAHHQVLVRPFNKRGAVWCGEARQ